MVIEQCCSCDRTIDTSLRGSEACKASDTAQLYREACKASDTCVFYDSEPNFLLDCEQCDTSFCIECATTHIHFVYCKFCELFHSEIGISWCEAVDRYENSSECSF